MTLLLKREAGVYSLLIAIALSLLHGCNLSPGPEARVEAYLRAAYKGDGLALEGMQALELGNGNSVTLDSLREGAVEGAKIPSKEEIRAASDEYDKVVAKESLALAARGRLKDVETKTIERNGDWACVQAVYRFEDGTTLAKAQYDGKFVGIARLAPDGYYFLLRLKNNWYVLQALSSDSAQRFSLTTAGALIGYLLAGEREEARKLMAIPGPGQTGESDPLSGSADSSATETLQPLSSWSLHYRGRRENGRVTVVSFEVRTKDVDEKVEVQEVAVAMRLRNGLWEVDRSEVASALREIAELRRRLEAAQRAKAARDLEAERQARLQPVVLLDQIRLIESSWQSPGLGYSFTPPSIGRLRLEVQVHDGSPLIVELMPPDEYQAQDEARRNVRPYQPKVYLDFRGVDVIRQSFEMPVESGREYVLFIRQSRTEAPTKVELRYTFVPDDEAQVSGN